MKKYSIREILTNAGVEFVEEYTSANGFHGTRFRFHKRELKKVDKTELKDHVKAYFKEWCVEVF